MMKELKARFLVDHLPEIHLLLRTLCNHLPPKRTNYILLPFLFSFISLQEAVLTSFITLVVDSLLETLFLSTLVVIEH